MSRNIFVWALYDFANSIIMISFLFYFSQWIVIDSGKPDFWFNGALIGSSLIFVLIAPILGQRLDATGKKIQGLRITSLITLFFFFTTSLIAALTPQYVFLATLCFTLGLAFYLITFVFYNPMINDFTSQTNRAWISGIGMAANYAGQVFGVLVVLPFALGALHLFGTDGRAQALFPAVSLCALFVLPMLIWYRDLPPKEKVPPLDIATELQKMRTTLKRIGSVKNLVFVLVGYFFVSNALLTFVNNFPLYLEKVYDAPDATKSILTAGILTISAIGSLIIGRLADRIGHRKTLLALLLLWMILLPLLAFSSSFHFAITICLVGGFFFGPVWSVARAMVADLAPTDITASTFSFYVISERFATLIGPFVWSFVLMIAADAGPDRYNYAILAMGALIIVGYLCIKKVSAPERTHTDFFR